MQDEPEREHIGTTCCRLVMKFFMSFIMFCGTIALQCGFFYYFMLEFIPEQLEKWPDRKNTYYICAVLFTFFDLMSVWSLIKTFVSNPGYVSDYFRAIRGKSNSVVRTNTPRALAEGE